MSYYARGAKPCKLCGEKPTITGGSGCFHYRHKCEVGNFIVNQGVGGKSKRNVVEAWNISVFAEQKEIEGE